MSDHVIITLPWGNINSETFLYGTRLTRESLDAVQFENQRMPAGTAIHEWYSYTNYQHNRDLPTLPFLYTGKTYRLEPNIISEPENTFILEVRFFDRLEQLAGRKVLYPPLYEFEYPRNGYYYTIRLTNGGCDKLTFHDFKLIEIRDDS